MSISRSIVFTLGALVFLLTEAPAQNRAVSFGIPSFPRMDNMPNPADRVERGPPQQLMLGGRPLYIGKRNGENGDLEPMTASTYRATVVNCNVSPALAAVPNIRQRVIDLATSEWAFFGFPVFDLGTTDVYLIPQNKDHPGPPKRYEIVPERLNVLLKGMIARRALRVGFMEDDTEVRRTIGGYWSALPGAANQYVLQQLIWSSYGDAGWAVPWSAAFISWVACESGLVGLNFRRNEFHTIYIDQAIDTRDGLLSGDQSGPFTAYDLWEVLPEVGDLVCRARDSSRFFDIESRRRERAVSPRAPAHCDFVVQVDTRNRRVYAIGGNVLNAVSLTMLDLVEDVRAPSKLRVHTAQDQPGAARWFVVLKFNKAGSDARSASIDKSPAVAQLKVKADQVLGQYRRK